MTEWLGSEHWPQILRALLTVLLGWGLARVVGVGIERLLRKRLGPQGTMLAKRTGFYAVLGLAVVSAVGELGFDLGVLLGAAGILTVALGFASQTSASNLISGLFLIGERPFSVGDLIKVGSTTGEVISIDLLSVKLKTFDNLFVRLPNEWLIKTEIVNLTRFPIRRIDLQIGVAYKENVGRVRDLLLDVADKNPLCLVEPAPLFIFKGFGDSALELQFSVWVKRENFLALKNSVLEEIKAAFEAAGIEIPYPQRTIVGGAGPLRVQLVSTDAPQGPSQPTER